MESAIKKAVFPVAGLGTAFLPVTKAIPKVMLPIVDKPLIQYAVDEAIAAGIKELIFVTSHSKRAIEDHFDSNRELESELIERGKFELLKIVRDILPPGVSCTYIRQAQPFGLGHAILCAKDLVGNEPFAVILADDLIEEGSRGCLNEMIPLFNMTQSSIIAVETIQPSESKKYGIVTLCDETKEHHRISSIVEKPEPINAPSNLGVVGRYILQHSIFKALEETRVGANGEIQLTDAISKLLPKEAVYAYCLRGKRFDCGSKLGFLEATVNYALKNSELAALFKPYLSEQLSPDYRETFHSAHSKGKKAK